MNTPDTTPQSNADIVAINLVMNAMVGEVSSPGESLAQLLERMAAISRSIGGDHRAAGTDWQNVGSDIDADSESEIKDLVNRQELIIGDTWAQHWLLMHLAKHLHCELEMRCLDSPAAAAIEKIAYDEDGGVATWNVRPN